MKQETKDNRNSVIFYRSFYEAINELPAENQLELYTSIFRYIFDKINPDLKGFNKTVWTLILPQLDANIAKFSNGCQGGRPNVNKKKTQQTTKEEPNDNLTVTETKPNDNLTVTQCIMYNVNDNVNDNVNVLMNNEKVKEKIYTEDFNYLWNLYEKKGSKKNAYKEYLLIKNKFNKEDIIEHIKYYKNKTEFKYTKDLNRYFKDRLWEDYEKDNNIDLLKQKADKMLGRV